MTIGQAAWEERAKEGAGELGQVLFRRWPPALNRLLHDWHVSLLDRALRDLPREGVRVLDIGCGPGRLARELAARDQVVAIVGVDHAPTFLEAFRVATAPKGTALQADLTPEGIPRDEFHLVLVAASLMYVPPALQAQVVSSLLSRLARGGRLLLIENDSAGLRAATWWGLLRRGGGSATVDFVFRPGQLEAVVTEAGGRVAWRRGAPLATVLLPILYAIAKVAPGVATRLGFVWQAGASLGWPSFQTALLAARANEGP